MAPDALARTLAELQQLERELVEQRLLRRAEGEQRIEEAIRGLATIGSPAGVLARATEDLGRSSDFNRVLISRVGAEGLEPISLWSSDDQDDTQLILRSIAQYPIALRYPLVESDVAERGEAQLVTLEASGSRAMLELAGPLGWKSYVVAPIVLERTTAGLLHADRTAGYPVDELDLELAVLYADGLARAFERAVLRDKLKRQRRQLELAGQWVNGQMLALSTDEPSASAAELADGAELTEVLTKRELEVLRLVANGMSNRAISTTLVLGEGTVKYHLKNVLRKLHARSRAEAVSTYMRMTKLSRRT